MRKNILKNKYGFSLIETMIAVSILMIAIAGPLSLVQAGLFSSIHQRNQVTATYLAQEAIEYIKNVRDSNSYLKYSFPGTAWTDWLKNPDGGATLDAICASPKGCTVDPHGTIDLSKHFKTVDVAVPIMQNTVNGSTLIYNYKSSSDSVQTTYTRVVTIAPPVVGGSTSKEVVVTVKMSWNDGAIPRTYTVSTNLLNYEVSENSTSVVIPNPSVSIGYMQGQNTGDNICPEILIYDVPGIQQYPVTSICPVFGTLIYPGYGLNSDNGTVIVTAGDNAGTLPSYYGPNIIGQTGIVVTH